MRFFGRFNGNNGNYGAAPSYGAAVERPGLMALVPRNENAYSRPTDLASAMMQAVDIRYAKAGDRHMVQGQYAQLRKRSRARLNQAMQAVQSQLEFGVASHVVRELRNAIEQAESNGLMGNELKPAQELLSHVSKKLGNLMQRVDDVRYAHLNANANLRVVGDLLDNLNRERCEKAKWVQMGKPGNSNHVVSTENVAAKGMHILVNPEPAPFKLPLIQKRGTEQGEESLPRARQPGPEVFTFVCENCNHAETPITASELMANGGKARCILCHWQGYPRQLTRKKAQVQGFAKKFRISAFS